MFTLTNWLTQHISSKMPDFFREHPLVGYYLQGVGLSLIIYLFYLELNPGIGGIFLRPDSKGETRFRFKGVWPMLKYPFQSINFWKPTNWDLNFIIFTGIGSTVYTGLKYYLNHVVSSS